MMGGTCLASGQVKLNQLIYIELQHFYLFFTAIGY